MTSLPPGTSAEIASLYEEMHASLTQSLDYLRETDNDGRDDEVSQSLSASMRSRAIKIKHVISELKAFRNTGNVEALRICHSYFYLGVDHASDLLNVISALQRLGNTEPSKDLTKEQFDIHNAVKKARVSVRKTFHPGWFNVEGFRENTRATLALAYRDPSLVPVIIELITERHFLEAKQVEGALIEMDRLATPLVQGAL